MYAWIWRHLPGPTTVRLVLTLVLALAVVAVLFVWIFPWLEPRLPFTDVTVESAGTPLASIEAAQSTALSTDWG